MTTASAGASRVTASPLAIWLLSRLAVAVTVFGAGWLVVEGTAGNVPSFVSLWDRWDTGLFVKVAHWGYLGRPQHYPDKGVAAFFPGEPIALRIVHYVVPNWVAAGLLISLVAGAVACVALARLGALEIAGSDVGSRAVLYLVLSPYAVFLAAAYSESLFLAFALPAWLAARRGRWLWAGVLGAGASFVRITGLFLAVALVVQWLLEKPGRRRWQDAAPLVLPFAAVGGYFLYLHHITGDWLAWQHAQQEGWQRNFTAPWTALHTSWLDATNSSWGAAYVWAARAEILAVVVGLVVCLVLFRARRWAELVYVGGQVAALATSSYYLSIARTTLLWWPLWLLLAKAATGRRWLHAGYLAVAPALMLLGVVAFTQGHWVD